MLKRLVAEATANAHMGTIGTMLLSQDPTQAQSLLMSAASISTVLQVAAKESADLPEDTPMKKLPALLPSALVLTAGLMR